MKRVLVKASNWKFILPGLLLAIFCIFQFQDAQSKMSQISREEVVLIDMRSDYALDEINDFFTKLKAEGREIHRYATGVIDMVFPIAYGTLFILLAAFFLKKTTQPYSNWLYLSLFPIILMIVDYVENINILNMLKKFPYLTTEMVEGTAKITNIKASLTNITLALLLILGIIWITQLTRIKFAKK